MLKKLYLYTHLSVMYLCMHASMYVDEFIYTDASEHNCRCSLYSNSRKMHVWTVHRMSIYARINLNTVPCLVECLPAGLRWELLFCLLFFGKCLTTTLFPISSGSLCRKSLWWVSRGVALNKFPITIYYINVHLYSLHKQLYGCRC